ncbi:enoyl-CoA hydratase-related protein [Kitasatospora sp. NPDC101183]|uniref:enoyl-CoA hydratase-related protein n=1 Tax=Kitasatospora sp. NPDC101183 TaxID=3364100 RepID=UPI00381562A7
MTEYRTIRVERRGAVGLVTLDRPKALNALNAELMGEVVSAAREFDREEGIGCLVVTGSQKAFAAGAPVPHLGPG